MRSRLTISGRGLVLATAFGALLLANRLSHPSHASYSEVQGHVYEKFNVGPVGPIRPVDPIIGAKVSNNRDSTTATTDNTGHFRLRVRPGLADDESVTLIVRTGSKVVCHPASSYGMVDIFLEGGPRQFANVRCSDNTTAK
jgi:hypothetical protein